MCIPSALSRVSGDTVRVGPKRGAESMGPVSCGSSTAVTVRLLGEGGLLHLSSRSCAALRHLPHADLLEPGVRSLGDDWSTPAIAGDDWSAVVILGNDWPTPAVVGDDWCTPTVVGDDCDATWPALAIMGDDPPQINRMRSCEVVGA